MASIKIDSIHLRKDIEYMTVKIYKPQIRKLENLSVVSVISQNCDQ